MNVPISIPFRAPASCTSSVINVPCSGAICSPDSVGNRYSVSLASSRRIASGGVLCAVRYAFR